MLGQPSLNGVPLARPSQHSRVPVAVTSATELADGSTAEYTLGHRLLWSLVWDLAPEDLAATVERLQMIAGPVEWVDLDGTSYVVTVNDRVPREAIPGTDPVRYRVGLGLQEHAPRVVPAPAPVEVVQPDVPVTPGAPVAVVSGEDPNILLVFSSAGVVQDPDDPAVLVWTTA